MLVDNGTTMREQHTHASHKQTYAQLLRVVERMAELLYFVINIAIITIIITQLLLLVFCQLAVHRHTLIMTFIIYSHFSGPFFLFLSLTFQVKS